MAVSGVVDGRLNNPAFHVAFKASSALAPSELDNGVQDGIYLAEGPKRDLIVPLMESGWVGPRLGPEVVDPETGAHLRLTEFGLERDGVCGPHLTINASMGTEDAGWVTRSPAVDTFCAAR